MYVVCNIVVGAVAHGSGTHDAEDLEGLGWDGFYHGAADNRPMYCGVVLGHFDECEQKKVSDLSLTPTPAQLKAARAKYDLLPVAIQAQYPFDVHLLWSSS